VQNKFCHVSNSINPSLRKRLGFTCVYRKLDSSFRHTHPIDSSIDTHQIQTMRRSSVRQERCAHTTKNRAEVLCPRVT
jgi:hypothetical protein